MTLQTLELQGTTPRARGEHHGESFRDGIHGIYAVRLRLMLKKTDLKTEENVLALARHHLPVLERFDRALFDELCGIAAGAGLTPEQLVVVNHYTDLRDLTANDLAALDHSADRGAGRDPGGCSAWFVDDGQHRVLGQTWDMHASATPYALLLTIPNDDGTKTVCFTIMGCLGMTGMTSNGLCLTINNLNSVDATVGVVWPALVRKALQQQTAKKALHLLQTSPIGSGRHYIVADHDDVFGMETSGTKKKVIFAVEQPRSGDAGKLSYFHTNHCVDDEMRPTAKILPGSTTVARYQTLVARQSEGRVPRSAREMFDAFEDVGLQEKAGAPDDVSTCGALVMDMKAKTALACQGIPGPSVTPVLWSASASSPVKGA